MRLRRGIERAFAALTRAWRRVVAVAGPIVGLLARVLGPRLSIVSAAGWIGLALGAVAIVAGYILGWAELTYIGFAIAAALLACTAFLVGRSTYSVDVELTPSRVVVGQRALGRLLVRNDGPRRVLPSRMELPVGDGLAEFALPSLAAGAEHDELFAVPTHRRAVIVAGPALSVRGDPLGVLRRTISWTDPIELFVHPQTVALAPSAAGLVRDLEGQVTKKITDTDLSFHALRPYQPGDDARYVHWRSSARTGTLMIRQFEETRRSQLTIVHTEDTRYYADEEEFELAVSVMASIATQVIRDGTQISVVSESRTLRTHTPIALLDDSSRLGLLAGRAKTAREFARHATLRLPPPSVVLVMAGSGMTTADHRAVQLLFPTDATIIGFRIERDAPAGLGTVAGMQLATIGKLADLPKVMRRAGA
jgi:uncharacterized protein (DUF58 family)